MKKLLIVATCFALSGCSLFGPRVQPIAPKIVTVDKPIPYIPAPPAQFNTLKQFKLLTPTLTPQSDPGTVAQYYKVDMYLLKSLRDIYEEIITQYQQGALNNVEAQKKIDELFKNIGEVNATVTPAPLPAN